jgi:hypothetical protein
MRTAFTVPSPYLRRVVAGPEHVHCRRKSTRVGAHRRRIIADVRYEFLYCFCRLALTGIHRRTGWHGESGATRSGGPLIYRFLLALPFVNFLQTTQASPA